MGDEVRLLRHVECVRASLVALFDQTSSRSFEQPKSTTTDTRDDVDVHYSQRTPSKRSGRRSESWRARINALDPERQHRLTLSLPPAAVDGSRKRAASTASSSSSRSNYFSDARVPFWSSDAQAGLFPTFWLDLELDSDTAKAQRIIAALWTGETCVKEWDLDLGALVSTDSPRESPLTFVTKTGSLLGLPVSDEPGSEDDEDGSGYASDPGSRPARARARPRMRQSKSRVMSLSTRETRMTKPASTDKLVQLVQSERVLQEMRNDLVKIRDRVEVLLDELASERHVGEKQDKLDDLAAVREVSTEEIGELQTDIDDKRRTLDRRKERLSKARAERAAAAHRLASQAKENELTAGRLDEARRKIKLARSIALTHLAFIYPIEPTDEPLVFSILGLPLANSSFAQSAIPVAEQTATALGHTASLVTLLSSYLSVPLPYTILFCGSRSVVQDDISSDIKGTRSFPLWERGTEKWRMEYAVFLLNKDVEALVSESRATTLVDLRTTLPNVKSLLLAFELSPSHPAYPPSLLPPVTAADLDPDQQEAASEEEEEEEEQGGLNVVEATGNRTRASSNASTIRASSSSANRDAAANIESDVDVDGNPDADIGQQQQPMANGTGTNGNHYREAEKDASVKRRDMSLWAGRRRRVT